MAEIRCNAAFKKKKKQSSCLFSPKFYATGKQVNLFHSSSWGSILCAVTCEGNREDNLSRITVEMSYKTDINSISRLSGLLKIGLLAFLVSRKILEQALWLFLTSTVHGV